MNLELNRTSLRFTDPDTEQAYRESALKIRRWLSISAPILIILLFSGLSFVSDYRLDPDNLNDLIFIRFFVVAPIALLLLLHALRASYGGLVLNGLAAALCVGLGQVAVTHLSPPDVAVAWFGLYLPIFVGTLILTALNHLSGTLVCLLIFAAHVFVTVDSHALDFELLLIEAINTVATLILLTLARYLIEFQSRSNFISETELAETARSLRKRETRLNDLYQSAPVPYATLYADGLIISEYNRAFADLLGYGNVDMRDLPWSRLVADESYGRISEAVFVKVLAGHSLSDREIRLQSQDGELKTILMSAVPGRQIEDFIDEIRLTLVDISERKVSENNLWVTQYAVDHSAQAAYWIRTGDAGFDYVNETACRQLGYDKKTLLELGVEDVDYQFPMDRWGKWVKSLRKKTYITAETRHRRKDGSSFPVQVVSHITEHDGKETIIAFVEDITRRQAEEHRQSLDHRDLATMALVNETIRTARSEEQMLQDICRILVEVNEQRFVWIGYAQDDDRKSIQPFARYGYEKGFLDIAQWNWDTHSDDPSPSGDAILKGRPEIVTDMRHYHSPRQAAALDRDYLSMAALPLSQGGDAYGVITLYSGQLQAYDESRIESLQRVAETLSYGIQSLRSQQRRASAEAELKTTEERSRQLLGSVAEGILGLDSNDRITFINPAGARMLGWEADALVGRRMHPLVHYNHPDGSHYKEEDCWINKTCRDGVPYQIDNEVFWHNDGHAVPVEYASLPISKDGEHMGAVVSFRDVSELKKMAEELRHAKEQADEANSAKGSFLANMSHEIRTPMNAIIGLSHLALGTELNRKQQDYLNKINISAKNLLGIINDILDFSKIEAGKLDVERTSFDLNEVLENIASVVGLKAGEKSLEFLIDHPMDLPMGLMGDPLRLGQVIINLANNSVKFTDEGSVTVRIGLLKETSDGYQLKFEVIDTGIGMTEEQQGRLFQAFSQADTSTTRKYGGTGLGLTISKRLVELMDGEIGVHSEYGKGSNFWFTARFGKADALPRKKVISDAELKGLKTLVVDDNAISRQILSRLCESFGLSVEEAPSGEEALEALTTADADNSPFRLTLLDWRMPGITGIEVAERILTMPLKTKPEMIMVSAYGREELMQQSEQIGLAGYLVKPVNASMLFDAIMQAFGREAEVSNPPRAGQITEVAEPIRGAHLLLAEDNEINQEVAREILQNAGFTLDIAENGQMALDMLDANPEAYAGVLMDLHMPVMDGLEATRRIREQARFRDLPVLAMTAAALQEERERCLAAGMNDHIAKPIDIDQLLQALAKHLRPIT